MLKYFTWYVDKAYIPWYNKIITIAIGGGYENHKEYIVRSSGFWDNSTSTGFRTVDYIVNV